MIKWNYYSANKGIHAFRWDTEFYDIVQRPKKIVLTYNESKGGTFEDDRNAFRIEFILNGAKTFQPEEGPFKGEDQYYAGAITEIRMYSQANDLQIKVSDISVPLNAVQGWFNRDEDFSRVFNFLDGFRSVHIGADAGGDSRWDEIRTGRANDTVDAKKGNDFIIDLGGKDSYNGGFGFDRLSYQEWYWDPDGAVKGIVADLKTGKIVGPDGYTDTVKGIEAVRGTFFRDVMRGDGKDNQFGGLAGNDLMDGRGGWDAVRYSNDDNQGGFSGIRANMKTGTIKDGFGNTDTVRNVEQVDGTDVRDIFTDGGRNNGYNGRDGNDTFRIYAGNDWMNGDGGADTFKFYGNAFGSDYIGDFNASEGDTLMIMAATDASDLKILSRDNGNDTLVRLNKNAEVYLEDVAVGSVDAGDFVA